MVDTLADWMLRYPSLFHGLEIAWTAVVCAFFGGLWLNAVIMPGKRHEYAFPRGSKARLWWRIGMLSVIPLVPLYWREWHAHGTVITLWDGAWAILCVSSIVSANVMGVQNVKQWKRTHVPKGTGRGENDTLS